MSQFTRLFARVVVQPIMPTVQHYEGIPEDIFDDGKRQKLMPTAQFLLVEQNEEGAFLYRFLHDGSAVGDTWHESVEDAKDQAAYEFGAGLSVWISVPPDVQDPLTYGMTATR